MVYRDSGSADFLGDRVLSDGCRNSAGHRIHRRSFTHVKAKFIRSLELLEKYGLLLREPWVRNIRGIPKLRELRFISFGEIYRVFFFPVAGRKLILLHGFKKKSQETPRRELQTAEARMKDYVQRQGGGL